MDTPSPGVVLAGVDGSASSGPVLRFAYDQARLFDGRLVAITAYGGEPGTGDWPDEGAAAAAQRALRAALVTALGAGRAEGVEARTAPRTPAAALIAESQWADLVVLGPHHVHPLHPQRSVVAQVIRAAAGPVAVVNEYHADRRGSIVAGVDGSPHARCALEWAARQAVAVDGTVDAVLAWEWQPEYSVFPYGERRDVERRSRETVLRGELSHLPPPLQERVRARVIEGHAVAVLAGAASEAGLLVLGVGAHHSVAERLLGSVSERLLRHAPAVPIVLVPSNDASPGATPYR